MTTFFSAHSLEILATLSGLLNIYFAARAHILNWFFGIITVSLYFIIFLQVKLYADMSLQIIFLSLQFYGLQQWLYGGVARSKLSITNASSIIFIISTFTTLILFLCIAFILQRYTDSTTVYIDAFTTALSLTAQWMMSKKWLEHWWLWIIVDIISIRMYLYKNLYFTSGLYFIFLLLCIYGYFIWKKQLSDIQGKWVHAI